MPIPTIDSPVGRTYDADQMEPGAEFEVEGPHTNQGGLSDKSIEDFLNEISTFLQDAFNQYDASKLRKDAIDTAEESRKAYRQKTDDTDWPWEGASNMITPLTRVAVDEMEPRLVQSLVGREPYLIIKHRPGASSMEDARDVEDYINYSLSEEVKLFPVTSKLVHKALLDGTVYPLVYWKRSDSPAFDGPQIQLISLEHVWHADDLDDDDWEDATVFRFVAEYTREELEAKAQQEDGWFPENLVGAGGSEVIQTTEQKLRNAAKNEVTETVKILEAYFTFGGQRMIAMVDKDSFKVLRLRSQQQVYPANTKLLRRFCIIREEGVSWGDPIYDVVRGVQEGSDAMWNRCVNSADITMTPWGFYQKGMSGAQSRLRVSPGTLLPVDKPDAFVFPNLGMFRPSEFVPLIQIYQSFWQRLTTSDYMQGMESQITGKKGSTATGTLAIIQEGKIKHEYRGTLLQFSFLDLLLTIYNIIAANMPQADVMPVTGKQVLQVQLSASYQFSIGPSSATANRFVERKETEDFVMVMQPYMNLLNPMAILNDILRSYGKRPEDYIDPELNQIVQIYLQKKANTQALVALGIPEPVAKQLTEKGVTPQNVEDFIGKMGEAYGQQAASARIAASGSMGEEEQGGPPTTGLQ